MKTRVAKWVGNQFGYFIYKCPECKMNVMGSTYGVNTCGQCNAQTEVKPPKNQ